MTYQATILADGPVGYWRLGEAQADATASDETGNHDGTYSGGVTREVAGAIVSQPNATAAQFTEATTDSVDIPDDPEIRFSGLSAFTLEGWVYVWDGLTQLRWWIARTTGPKWGMGLNWDGSNIRHRFRRGSDELASDFIYDLETWYHVAGTFDGVDTMRLYVNGQQVATRTTSGNVSTDSVPIRIGRDTGNGADARVDEVAIYDKLLTQPELQAHYEAGIAEATSSSNRIGGSGAIRRPARTDRGNRGGGGGGGRPVDTGPPPDRGGGRPTQPPAGPPPTTEPTPDEPLEYPPEVPTVDRRRVLPGEDEPTTDSGD